MALEPSNSSNLEQLALKGVNDVCGFQVEQCNCKGSCNSKSCSCVKKDRRCRRHVCGCGSRSQCQNARDDDDEGGEETAGEGTSSVMSASATATSTEEPMECDEATRRYNPKLHNAMWQNDNPFVLRLYSRRLKKCRGCDSPFAGRKEAGPKFVISHEEQREFWTTHGHGQRTAPVKVFYHCSASCIKPRHRRK